MQKDTRVVGVVKEKWVIKRARLISHNENFLRRIKYLPFRYTLQITNYIDWRIKNMVGYNIILKSEKTLELFDFYAGVYIAIKNKERYKEIIEDLKNIPCIEFWVDTDRHEKPTKAQVWECIEPHLPKELIGNIRKKTLQKIREGLKSNDIVFKKMFLVKNKITRNKLISDQEYKEALYNIIYNIVMGVKLPFSTIDHIDLINDMWLELINTGNEKLYYKIKDNKFDEVQKMIRKHMYQRIKNIKNNLKKREILISNNESNIIQNIIDDGTSFGRLPI